MTDTTEVVDLDTETQETAEQTTDEPKAGKWNKTKEFIEQLKTENAQAREQIASLERERDRAFALGKSGEDRAFALGKYGEDVVESEDVKAFFEKYPDGSYDDAIRWAWFAKAEETRWTWRIGWAWDRTEAPTSNNITATRYSNLSPEQQKDWSLRVERWEAKIDWSK